jgi:hypothetical protein
MSLFVSATALHRETSRVLQTGSGRGNAGSDISISSFGSVTTPAASPAEASKRVGLSPSAAEFLSQLTQAPTAADQGATGAMAASASDPANSSDAHLSSVFASLEADLADLVSGLGASGTGAASTTAGGDPAPQRANLHNLLQALDADPVRNPSARTGSTRG